MKKSTYKTLAEAIVFGGLKDCKLPTSRVNHRRLTVDEIKAHIMEEFGEAKKADSVEADELENGWGDAELEKEIDWINKLDIKEFFYKKGK